MLAALLAAPGTPAQSPGKTAAPAPQTYGQAIGRVQRALARRDHAAAQAILHVLAGRYPDNQEVLGLMARNDCEQGKYTAAKVVYGKIPAGRRHSELRHAVFYCREERKLDLARQALKRGDYGTAISLSRSLYRQGYDAYASGLLLAQSYSKSNEFAKAEKIYVDLSRRYPADEDLKKLAEAYRVRKSLDVARKRLNDGDYHGAILIASSLYKQKMDVYGAGLIMASAYFRSGRIRKAAAIYGELHSRFPEDREISRQSQKLEEMIAISRAKTSLSQGDTSAAIASLTPIYENVASSYRYDAGMLLASAYMDEVHPNRALGIYARLLKSRPGDASLKGKYDQLREKEVVGKANSLMGPGDYAAAISVLEPYYHASAPRYGIGMTLGRAYTGNHEPDKAASVYASLQRAYPSDKEFPELRLQALLAARHYPEASKIYRSLGPAQRKSVANNLGYQARHLYLYSATVGGQYVKDSNGYPDERAYELRLKAVTDVGTFVGHYEKDSRFGGSADNYRLDYYYSLHHGWYGYLSYAHSPQSTFLADNDYTLAVNKVVGGFTLMASYRHLAFSRASANVYFGGVGFYPASRLYLVTGAFYVPRTSAYSLMVEPVWLLGNGQVYAYLSAGQAGEQFNVNGAVTRAASYSIRIGRRLDITPRLGLAMEGFYEYRAHLYSREGIGIYLTWRW